MDKDTFKQELKQRATAALLNEDEVSPLALEVVFNETKEEVGDKTPKSWAVMDFAMQRLKIYLKIEQTAEDISLLKQARQEIERTKVKKVGALKYASV